ncbi:Zinc finger and BTB domain-containing protein 49 [Araneus ventricosus]|uniref:Zinc finger and BTB domain-containing protein 49 n=1 Tax=Araneus ventricosus TaxID=182803 RepID=A0A4Y2SU59_ARAVE|nr:Zinc finger and BTB domain-containing protein 49 [Araneus ventricosus]
MVMRAFPPNGEMASNFYRLTSMACHLGLGEDDLNMPSIPNSSNNKPDFSLERFAINGMPKYKVPKLDVFEEFQSEPKIQNDPSKFMAKLVERIHGYEISSVSNEPPVINDDRGRINHDLIMVIKPDSEIAVENIRLSEMYHQFSKYGQDTQTILMINDLDSMTDYFAVTEAKPSRPLVLNSMPMQGSPERSGSIYDKVIFNGSNAEMMRRKCTNATTENKIVLNDMNGRRNTEESATIGNSFTEKSDSFEDYPIDAAHVLSDPSFSQFNEPYTSVCLKEFQTKGNVKRHSMLRNSHFRKHMIIHKGINQNKCDVCTKLLRRKGHFQRHAFTHTDDKLFKCEVCGKSFRQKRHLLRQVLTRTGDKAYECIICGKKFANKSNLHSHKKTHKPK